jgi:hypothetical protein
MQFVLLVGNAKRVCDMFLSVNAVTGCKSDDTVESLYEEFEYVLNQFAYYYRKILLGCFGVDTGREEF